MSVGICVNYCSIGPAEAAIRLAELCSRKEEVQIRPTHGSSGAVDPVWDVSTLRNQHTPFPVWAKRHDTLIWFGDQAPSLWSHSVVSDKRNYLIPLGSERMLALDLFQRYDKVICPHSVVTHFVKKIFPGRSPTTITWDSGMPYAFPHDVPSDEMRVYCQLPQPLRRQYVPYLLGVFAGVLEAFPHVFLTLRSPRKFQRRERTKVAQLTRRFPGRILLLAPGHRCEHRMAMQQATAFWDLSLQEDLPHAWDEAGCCNIPRMGWQLPMRTGLAFTPQDSLMPVDGAGLSTWMRLVYAAQGFCHHPPTVLPPHQQQHELKRKEFETSWLDCL